jgi:DNA-binding transcriptional LysR family regulator
MRWIDRAGRRVSLRHLHIFMAVVDSGSIAKAAALLSISHPVVSKTISDLEHVLGVKLLERGPHGVEPTGYGRACLDCGLAVFDELRRGLQNIEHLTEPYGGELRVGAAEPMKDLLSSIVEQVARKYPRIIINFIMAEAKPLHEMLRGRQADVVVSRRVGPNEHDFAHEPFFEQQLFVVSGRKSRWANRRKIELADLMDEPWVLPDSANVIAPLIAECFRSNGLRQPAAQVIANSLRVRETLASRGHFLTILPSSSLYPGDLRTSLKILPVALPVRPQLVEIITLKGRSLSPVTKLFLDSIRRSAELLIRVR